MKKNNALTQAKPRKAYFRMLKKIMKVRYKEPTFIYLDGEIQKGSIILSNHEGTDGPMAMEIYLDHPFRMWGAGEMNSDLISLYKYQTEIYYHQKKHWNIHAARAFCLIASPITKLFYSGLDLISTWQDARFVKTLKTSLEAITSGDSIVIYPEISDKGYLAELEGFHPGFVLLAEYCFRKGIDVPIYVTYFRKGDNTYIVDKPVYYSDLVAAGESRDEIAARLCARCNELGKMTSEEIRDIVLFH